MLRNRRGGEPNRTEHTYTNKLTHITHTHGVDSIRRFRRNVCALIRDRRRQSKHGDSPCTPGGVATERNGPTEQTTTQQRNTAKHKHNTTIHRLSGSIRFTRYRHDANSCCAGGADPGGSSSGRHPSPQLPVVRLAGMNPPNDRFISFHSRDLETTSMGFRYSFLRSPFDICESPTSRTPIPLRNTPRMDGSGLHPLLTSRFVSPAMHNMICRRNNGLGGFVRREKPQAEPPMDVVSGVLIK